MKLLTNTGTERVVDELRRSLEPGGTLDKFLRDGVIGAIDKLERFGGCIIADSVGLGKTFEALAIITLPRSADAAAARREALTARGRLQRDITSLRGQAQREKQLSRRVDLNRDVQRLEAELKATVQALEGAAE